MPSDHGAAIELRGLRKEFDSVTAVDGIDLSVKRGEFFSLLGPSGCGKTTTLRMISGFETPTGGDVILNGRNASDVPPNERDTNLVFQHLSLFPHMTVGENVGYGLKKSGVGREQRRDRVSEYLDLVDLAGLEDRNPTELSGGQQQRVALARALVNEPGVVLLDEPLGSLDRKLRQQMRIELRRIHEEFQGSFFYVTHNQNVAMTLSDRMAVMRDGRIEQVGPPERIYNEPASVFVADFIGDTNLFEATTTRTDGRTVVDVGSADHGFSFSVDRELEADDWVVSIRPEDIRLSASGADGRFGGEVVERYFEGDQTNYIVDPTDPDMPLVDVVSSGRHESITEGRSVTMTFNDSPVVLPE